MPANGADLDSFLKLADSLGELEVTVGPKARPVVAEIRAKLAEAAVRRSNGNMPAAIAAIGAAMDRLAALASELDPSEGLMMRMIADRFSQALSFGDKSAAKENVNIMRHKAGDPKDDPETEW